MARARVPKGQVFVKKEEKILKTLNNLKLTHSDEDFILKFQDLYPNDWQKIVARYEAHEKLTPKGKSHPMPKPEKYLLNISYKLRTAYAKGEMLSSVVQESETED
ncbi:hypothetical protein PN465_22985 [Nodularia spumigena CS-584]|jgi:hypothetical protein|uniref:hypothetical protein n=1 Tax=Nodularia spumigena TaxID=70799 RepID=UPI0000EAC81E|nr:hypothetical protein [Nodularia spumigena]AHJ26996.1 hypothetical protein NSP_6480 [Nodularia spumigena CCY9414]EAW44491.1 hypothetical protein N9414_16314 [Nodularia spumigena CCY9414]MDB9385055.1 hypothetical protein [Nodularia spumigena CS-584]